MRILALLSILALAGCAQRPLKAPSTATVTGDIRAAQTAVQQADAKATVILQWLDSQK